MKKFNDPVEGFLRSIFTAEFWSVRGPGVWIAGAQASWRSPDTSIEAGVFARNVFNEDYFVSISNIDSLGQDLLTYNKPRSLGVFLRYHY